jgi:hypothetical protein
VRGLTAQQSLGDHEGVKHRGDVCLPHTETPHNQKLNRTIERGLNRSLPRGAESLQDTAEPVHARRTARRHFPEQDCCRPRVYCEPGGDRIVASGWLRVLHGVTHRASTTAHSAAPLLSLGRRS